MKTISLTKGMVALVDDDDYEKVCSYTWYASPAAARNTFYAVASIPGGRKKVYMHRLILSPQPGFVTDHKNRNGLDNRKENLRYATNAQNAANRPMQRKRSPFRGIHSYRRRKDGSISSWRATISIGRKRVRLGIFKTAEEAARAYDAAALLHYGEFAVLNFPRIEG